MNHTSNTFDLATRFPTRIHRLTSPHRSPRTCPAPSTSSPPSIPTPCWTIPSSNSATRPTTICPTGPSSGQRPHARQQNPHRILLPSRPAPQSSVLSPLPSPPSLPRPRLRPGHRGIAAASAAGMSPSPTTTPKPSNSPPTTPAATASPPAASAPSTWTGATPSRKPSLILASDVLYERRLHPLVLDALEKLLAPTGAAWVSDPQRTSAENFPLAAVDRGFKVTTINMEGESFSGGKQAGQLYILTRALS